MTRTALVVEDDPVIRQLMTIALSGDGCAVLEAGDGLTALSTAERERPDVILLDIGLPDVDGLTVLRTLKSDDQLRAIPVVMVTAWADPDMVRRALDRGANDYVCKPFAVEHLLERVDAAVERPSGVGTVADPVTGLPGPRHLPQVLERQAAAAHRVGRPFAVVIADLDEADPIHAEHGHQVTNDVLRAFAKRLRRAAGVSDVLVRFDRHSIAIVLPGATYDAALARADDLRSALVAEPLDTPTLALPVTASFGVAAAEPAEHPSDVLTRAADALCVAMAAGGDVVRGDAPLDA